MSAHVVHITEIVPQTTPESLIAGLVPPPHFDEASFESYRPDPNQPSQAQARDALMNFVGPKKSAGVFSKLFGGKSKSAGKGIYLDGGYGVGKTHLLASAWHAEPKPAAFGTFVEYTNLIGALGFPAARDVLKQMNLVCVDEFELDDPGDTVMMSRMMRELTDAGVKIIATSNTLPGALGQGRFAAQDFLREIQALASQFEVLSIDGEDYRHRGIAAPEEPVTDAELDERAAAAQGTVAVDDFAQLLEHLSKVHPSRYGKMLADIDQALWHDVFTMDNEGVALRFVALVDRMYDRNVRILNSGVRLDKVFTDDMLAGGYKKKYMRCLSRLAALSAGVEQ